MNLCIYSYDINIRCTQTNYSWITLSIYMNKRKGIEITYCSPGKSLYSLKWYTLYVKIKEFCRIGKDKMRLEFMYPLYP